MNADSAYQVTDASKPVTQGSLPMLSGVTAHVGHSQVPGRGYWLAQGQRLRCGRREALGCAWVGNVGTRNGPESSCFNTWGMSRYAGPLLSPDYHVFLCAWPSNKVWLCLPQRVTKQSPATDLRVATSGSPGSVNNYKTP